MDSPGAKRSFYVRNPLLGARAALAQPHEAREWNCLEKELIKINVHAPNCASGSLEGDLATSPAAADEPAQQKGLRGQG